MSWLQISFLTNPDIAQSVADQLSELGAAAVTFEDAADQPIYEPAPGETLFWNKTRITGLFDAEVNPEQLQRELGQISGLKSFPNWSSKILEDQDWERAWMADFKPMQFGPQLWVCPSDQPQPDPAATNIILDPGLAFGTGTHATTALCLQWLGQNPVSDYRVIDFGCGSGILAIAAALLGASEIQAIDIDEQALIATADNAKRNQVSQLISTSYPEQLEAPRVDLLLANILAGPLVELAPKLADHTKAGGQIVLSGILIDQTESVLSAYKPFFEMNPTQVRDDWVCLSGRRKKS